MIPNIYERETALKLALIGCIKESIVEKELLIEYMIEILNK
jgi:hypothetical protein